MHPLRIKEGVRTAINGPQAGQGQILRLKGEHETAPNTVELVVGEVGADFQAGAGFDVHQSTQPFLAGPSLRIRWIPARLSSSP